MSLELAANWYMTRAHWSVDLAADRRGKRGLALCSTEGRPVDVFDQAHHDAVTYGGPAKAIELLPLCKRCERKAAALGGSGGQP